MSYSKDGVGSFFRVECQTSQLEESERPASYFCLKKADGKTSLAEPFDPEPVKRERQT